VHRVVDAAFFYDAGTVAPRLDNLAFSRLKTSYGIGVRIISNTNTFLRLDVGHSRDGTRLFVSVGEVFRPGHRSILVPFIPWRLGGRGDCGEKPPRRGTRSTNSPQHPPETCRFRRSR